MGVTCIIGFVAFALFTTLFRGQPLPNGGVRGVVISAGPLSTNRGQCPDSSPNQMATVRLASGRVVYATVASAITLQPGTSVQIRQWQTACNPSGYEVVLRE